MYQDKVACTANNKISDIIKSVITGIGLSR